MKEDVTFKTEDECDLFKNIMAFLFCMLEDWEGSVASLHPNYVKEKFIRYIQCPAVKNEYIWGLHPLIKQRLEDYCNKYDIPFNADEEARNF
jgi:hypothetical protein